MVLCKFGAAATLFSSDEEIVFQTAVGVTWRKGAQSFKFYVCKTSFFINAEKLAENLIRHSDLEFTRVYPDARLKENLVLFKFFTHGFFVIISTT